MHGVRRIRPFFSLYTLTNPTVNKIIMRLKKKYAAIILIVVVIIINILSTLRLLFAVSYPDRVLKEVISEYFKNNLNKAVKFEDLYMDYSGKIVISDFNISITSDFNDNVSLVKSEKAVVNLAFFSLFTGTINLKGIDFYDSEITFIKKYGRSHLDCFYQILDPDKFINKIRNVYGEFYIEFHRATMFYRESLRDKQITIELNKIDAGLVIDKNTFSYSVSGYSKPYKTRILRKGSFSCEGTVDIKGYDSFKHRIKIDNFDLTYFNEHIQDYKLADVAVSGGGSVDVSIGKNKDTITVKGRAETNSLTVSSIKKKYNILSNENMNCDVELVVNTELNSYALRKLKADDDVVSLEAAGTYIRNNNHDAIKLKFKTNKIDLSDLSQNFTPYKDTEYSGTLQGDGGLSLDFKNSKATGMRLDVALDGFTLTKIKKGGAVPLIDESNIRLKLSDTSIDIDINAKPLQSDLGVKSRTSIASWIPFKSDTQIDIISKKMNLDNVRLALVYLIDKAYASAYDDKRGGLEKVPFLQSPMGKFMNNNTIALKSKVDSVFYGKRARWKDYVFNAQLSRGSVSISEFNAEGYEAKYRLAGQAYFNSDQPYVKIEGKVDDFDLAGFYAESGMSGSMTGKARSDFSYEVSVSRLGDILDNAKGHLNVYIGRGVMRNTKLQRNIMKFLRKNGHPSDSLSAINFEDIMISISEQGENFWFSNFGIRGDTILFNAVGDYLYEGGITSTFGLTVRKDAIVTNVPLRLYGPILAPCVDVVNKKDSQKLCF
jgi:hypothetical protein